MNIEKLHIGDIVIVKEYIFYILKADKEIYYNLYNNHTKNWYNNVDVPLNYFNNFLKKDIKHYTIKKEI